MPIRCVATPVAWPPAPVLWGKSKSDLGGLRDELGRLAAQSTGQAQALNGLLEQQASVATGLAQVARDISTISLRTAQRQDDVSREVGSWSSALTAS